MNADELFDALRPHRTLFELARERRRINRALVRHGRRMLREMLDSLSASGSGDAVVVMKSSACGQSEVLTNAVKRRVRFKPRA